MRVLLNLQRNENKMANHSGPTVHVCISMHVFDCASVLVFLNASVFFTINACICLRARGYICEVCLLGNGDTTSLMV